MDAAIIGAASALAGVALAQGAAMLQQHLAARRERRALLRAKLEEMADCLYRVDLWTHAWLQQATISSDAAAAPLPPSTEARRARALALLYFPALRQDTDTFARIVDGFYLATGGHDTDKKTLVDSSQAFAQTRARLLEGIAQEAQRLL